MDKNGSSGQRPKCEELFRHVQKALRLGCWEMDLGDNRLAWSDGMYTLYGLDPANGIPEPEFWSGILVPPEPSDIAGNLPMGDRIGQALRGEVPYVDDFRILRQDTGEMRYIHTVGEVVTDHNGTPVRLVGIVQDVTEQKMREKEIVQAGYRDELTGLYNRRFFEEEIRRIDTRRQWPLSILIGEVAGLKMANDVYGYAAGDHLLASAADLLRSACRSEDLVSRWRGDEFIVCLPKTDAANAGKMLERIQALHGQKALDGGTYPRVSLGCATKTDDSTSLGQVIRDAEDDKCRRMIEEDDLMNTVMIDSMAETLFEREIEREGHASRIAGICRQIGKRLEMPEALLEELDSLARLHDIGLIAMSTEAIHRSGPLTSDDWAEMHRHPETGHRITRSSREGSRIAGYILAHHERWDGSGYPKRLSGRDIPLQARIFAIADTYTAMTEPRPYRPTPGVAAAREEIRSQAGYRFDPALVAVFLDVYDADGMINERSSPTCMN